jgi:hypothetical protein
MITQGQTLEPTAEPARGRQDVAAVIDTHPELQPYREFILDEFPALLTGGEWWWTWINSRPGTVEGIKALLAYIGGECSPEDEEALREIVEWRINGDPTMERHRAVVMYDDYPIGAEHWWLCITDSDAGIAEWAEPYTAQWEEEEEEEERQDRARYGYDDDDDDYDYDDA